MHLTHAVVAVLLLCTPHVARAVEIATFSADVTPPLGHPLLGNTTAPPPAWAIADPLLARGLVLTGDGPPVVLAAIDWCEIRNDAFDRWREVLAAAAGTTRERVLVTAVHQHDAPLADLEAQRILDASPRRASIIDPAYHERCVQVTAAALRDGLKHARRVTHLGTGQAKVDRIASNRRYVDPAGRVRFDRGSMSGGKPAMNQAADGLIDPWLKTLSFFDGDVPLCAVHVYAVHPMGHWGSGRVSADFPGLARARMQESHPSIFQIYASGCAGDTTAGRYNDGSDASTRALQDRLYQAMEASWQDTKRRPLERVAFRSRPVELPLRTSAGYSAADLARQLEADDPRKRALAALGLSWRKRHEAGRPIDLPVIDFGSAALALLPGESYVDFQLTAQKMRPDDFVVVMGYGESAPGFVPPDPAWVEQDGNLSSWCWVDPGAEKPLKEAVRAALVPVPDAGDARSAPQAAPQTTVFLPATAGTHRLPGTQPLPPNADFSAAMVAGIDRMALRLIGQSKATRKPTREKLRAALGMVDERLPVTALEFVGDTAAPALLHETERCRVFRVRWPVFDGVHGEGVFIQPKGTPHARLILLPDADEPPEKLVDPRLLAADCEVVIPALVGRGTRFSTTDRLGIRTNVPHREWIYRQSFQLGRHLIGYEVQKALAVVDWFEARPERVPVIVAGLGEGGMLALHAGALDERIDGVFSAGSFAPREGVWQEPLDRNVFGLLRDFGDAEIASLIAPRPLVLQHARYPDLVVSMMGGTGERTIAAPGRLAAPQRPDFDAEVARAKALAPQGRLLALGADGSEEGIVRHLLPGPTADRVMASLHANPAAPVLGVDDSREERTVRELGRFAQRLIVACEAERQARFWDRVPLEPLAAFEAHTARERERFWNEVVGRLPDPNLPMNAKSRLVRETEKVTIHEVSLDVWNDVFAWGWLCLPKDLRPGERRPVIVCQHGLEGLPEDTVTADRSSRAWGSYKSFALRLAEEGFVTFAPHNPYRGKDAFRVLQRKLNPLGLTLYSVINGQHQRILEWLKAQPFTRSDKIAFYGLSYGGRSAVHIPAVLTDYCLSISSANFDEWVRYCVSTELPIPGYMHAGEYEIWDWNLARSFSHAEMAALIAPRPFMVERGHDDGSGTDEMVDYEYAKVRRLYAKLGLDDRTTIEHFDGPHTIHGVGTFEFLKDKLGRR